MDIFAKDDLTQDFNETLSICIPCDVKNNNQAYALLCINELLHTMNITTEDNYSIIYSIITDSSIFTEF